MKVLFTSLFLFWKLWIYSAYISHLGSAYSLLGWCWLVARALLLTGCSSDLRDGSYSERLTSASFFSGSLWRWTYASWWRWSHCFVCRERLKIALVSVFVLAWSWWSSSRVPGRRLCSARIRSCRCCKGFGTIWVVIRCFSRGHCIACTSDGCWGSISCTVPLLACRLNFCLLWSQCNSCAPVQHGWSMARTAYSFGCGGMLRAFVQYPLATSDAKVLLTCWGCTTHYGCCLTLCHGY
jgi:hypothetical protein